MKKQKFKIMIKYLKYFIFLFIIELHGQESNIISEAIQSAKNSGQQFTAITHLLTPLSQISVSAATIPANYFNYSTNTSEQVLNNPSKYITLNIPSGSDILILDLMEVPASFYDFKVETNSGKNIDDSTLNGKHYRGMVRGQDNSLAALSIYNNKIMGIISTSDGKILNIGKISGDSNHVLYDEADLIEPPVFECGNNSDYISDDLQLLYDNLQNNSSVQTVATMNDKCIKIYFETDYEIYQNLDYSTANVIEFVMGLFNQVAALYTNESINVELSEIFIWDTDDIYSTDICYALKQFIDYRYSVPQGSNLAHLLTYTASGGGGWSEGTGGLLPVEYPTIGDCNYTWPGDPNPGPHAHSKILLDFEDFPIYSRSVKVITHEIGHNLGSRHTHACIWNSKIDDCGNVVSPPRKAEDEGYGCFDEDYIILPADGGTIMSYCDHIDTIGVNFNHGFGTQPGDLIRAFVDSKNDQLDNCYTRPEYLIITDDVMDGDIDLQSANNTIISSNVIHSGGTAEYKAGQSIILKPGFHAKEGSTFRAYIDSSSD